jgi:hypothetical protein
MVSHFIRRAAVTLAGVGAAVMIFAASVRADVTGPQAFYFEATCSDIGTVLMTNVGQARTTVFQVVGQTTVVLLTASSNPAGPPGLANLANAAGTTCTFFEGGPSPDQLQPFPPITEPVLIR